MKKTILLNENRKNKRFVYRYFKNNKHKNVQIILMALPLPVHQVTGAINFPDDKAGIITRATFIHTKSLASGLTFPGTTLADYLTAITTCATADAASWPGKFKAMNNAAQFIMAVVQKAADADPVNSISILQSCGFNVIPAHGAHIAEFSGVPSSTIRGAVDLVTAGGPQAKDHLHQWWSSLDGINWIREQATNGRKQTVEGFAHGKDVYFKVQLSIQDVLQPMSNIITVLVN